MPSSTSSFEPDAAATARPAFPWGFVLTVVAALALEGALAGVQSADRPTAEELERHRYYTGEVRPLFDESVFQWKLHGLFASSEPRDVLLLGDSSCLVGLRPATVQAATGRQVWNLGTTAGFQADGHADLLELDVERHGPPKLVVYHAGLWPLIEPTPDPYTRTRVRRWLRLYEGDVPSWLPSFRLRRCARSLLPRVFSGEVGRELEAKRGLWPADEEVRRELEKERGWIGDPHEWRYREPVHMTGALAEDHLPGLTRMASLADARGFELALAVGPLPELARTPETEATLRAVEVALQAFAGQFKNVKLVTPLGRFYPVVWFGNLNHVRPPGAERNSRELGSWIREAGTSGAAGS